MHESRFGHYEHLFDWNYLFGYGEEKENINTTTFFLKKLANFIILTSIIALLLCLAFV